MNGIVPEFQHVKNPSLPTTANVHPFHPSLGTVSAAAMFYYFFLFRSAGGRLQRDPGARHKLHDWSNGGHPLRLCRRGCQAGSIFRRTAGTSLVCPPPPPRSPSYTMDDERISFQIILPTFFLSVNFQFLFLPFFLKQNPCSPHIASHHYHHQHNSNAPTTITTKLPHIPHLNHACHDRDLVL
uniref:Uncharacterized protein n=1 Tax=Schizaphis graminum TaxID=13262 RepID=A0A2S2NQT5_SCHGA